jgi:hypothetical protein
MFALGQQRLQAILSFKRPLWVAVSIGQRNTTIFE